MQERIEVKECDLHKFDFDDETSDMVLCDHALWFIKEQEMATKELVRVLKISVLQITQEQQDDCHNARMLVPKLA